MSGALFVALHGVTRHWNRVGGVCDMSLAVAEGELVSILGPSGCGKSAVLRILARLQTPQAGRAEIAGRDVTALPPAERGRSMVFQSYALFPHHNLRTNILFGMKVGRAPRPEREAALVKAVAMTGLTGLDKRRPVELSGGQRQRVALARAVVSERPLCLVDEPLSNLDVNLRHSVRRDIKALMPQLGLTVVYVTHDQTEAMSLSDHVVVMRAGRTEQIASPRGAVSPAGPALRRALRGRPAHGPRGRCRAW